MLQQIVVKHISSQMTGGKQVSSYSMMTTLVVVKC